MANKIVTLQNAEKTEGRLPRTCLKAIFDDNENYLDPELTADDLNVLKGGAFQSLMWTKLWDNPSPTSSFSAQTIPLDLSSYRFVYVTYRDTGTENYLSTSIFPVTGVNGVHSSMRISSSSMYMMMRSTSASTNGVSFGNAFGATVSSPTYSSDNALLLPIAIYGIK